MFQNGLKMMILFQENLVINILNIKKPPSGGFLPHHDGENVEAPSRFELESEAFAELCLTTWPWRRYGAVDEIRTRDIHLGKVALYH